MTATPENIRIMNALAELEAYEPIRREEESRAGGKPYSPEDYAGFIAAAQYDLGAADQMDDMDAEAGITPEKSHRAEALEKRAAIRAETLQLLSEARDYQAQGYRLRYGHRFVRGLHYDVPAQAIVYRLVPAGHISTSEAVRVMFLVKHKVAEIS